MISLDKKKLNKVAKSDGLKVITAFIVIIIGLLINNFSLKQIMDWKYFSSIILAAIFLFVIERIQGNILNYTEDTVKLSEDYDKLVEKYNNVNFVTTDNEEKLLIEKIDDLSDKTIIFEDDNSENKKYNIPKVVDNNFNLIFKSHSTSKISNSKSIRLKDYKKRR